MRKIMIGVFAFLLVVGFVAPNLVLAEEGSDTLREEYKEKIDVNEDGTVGARERRRAEVLRDRADVNDDGRVGIRERERVRAVRDRADVNDDGKLGKRERVRARELRDRADVNDDGKLGKRERVRARELRDRADVNDDGKLDRRERRRTRERKRNVDEELEKELKDRRERARERMKELREKVFKVRKRAKDVREHFREKRDEFRSHRDEFKAVKERIKECEESGEPCDDVQREYVGKTKEFLLSTAETLLGQIDRMASFLEEKESDRAAELLEKLYEIRGNVEESIATLEGFGDDVTRKELREVASDIRESWKKTKRMTKAVVHKTVNRRIHDGFKKMQHLEERLNEVRDKLADKGADVTTLDGLLDRFSGLLDTVAEHYKAAEETREDDDASVDVLKAEVSAGRDAYKEAVQLIREIMQEMRALRESVRSAGTETASDDSGDDE